MLHAATVGLSSFLRRHVKGSLTLHYVQTNARGCDNSALNSYFFCILQLGVLIFFLCINDVFFTTLVLTLPLFFLHHLCVHPINALTDKVLERFYFTRYVCLKREQIIFKRRNYYRKNSKYIIEVNF